MSSSNEGRPLSAGGVALASLTLGIITLVLIKVPFLPLLPGSLAVLFGLSALNRMRQNPSKAGKLAIAGIVCAFIGMAPTALVVPALFGWGELAAKQVNKQIQNQQNFVGADADESQATLILKRDNSGAYSISQKMGGSASMSSNSNSAGATSELSFSNSSTNVQYKGLLKQDKGKRLDLSIELENTTPFKLTVEGLENATVKDGSKTISLADPLPPGKHKLTITSNAK